MTTPTSAGSFLSYDERRAVLEHLLAEHPTSAIGIVDPTRKLDDVVPVFAQLGLAVGDHAPLSGGALAEHLAVGDVGLIGDAAQELSVRGAATRVLHLRDGRVADLHLFMMGESTSTTIVVIVPGANEVIGTSPAPSAIVASPRVGLAECDAFGVITHASSSTATMIGDPHVQLVGASVIDLLHAEDQQMAIVNWLAAKEQRGDALRWRCRLARADGSSLWIEATIKNDADVNGRIQIELNDVSAEVAAIEALVAERELIELLTETLPVGVAMFDRDGRVEHANGRLRELLAPLDHERLISDAVRGQVRDRELATAFTNLLHSGTSSRHLATHGAEDGTVRHLEWTVRAAFGSDGHVSGGVVCVADVTEAAQLREILERRAITDPLTGCLNRAGTMAALEHSLDGVGCEAGVGLLFIDLDGFKGVNDSRGHAAGDRVLEVVAARLRSATREGDVVGRIGGDEFVIISPCSARAARIMRARISRALHGTAMIMGAEVSIRASIGTAWTAIDSASELLAAADAAMYVDKRRRSSRSRS